MKHTQSPFKAEWISFGLEDLIDLGDNTYMYAKYENLPPVDENTSLMESLNGLAPYPSTGRRKWQCIKILKQEMKWLKNSQSWG